MPKRANSRAAGKRERGDAPFACRVGRLADLALEGRDRRGVDDYAPLAVGPGRIRRHRRGGEAKHVERADQIHLHDAGEELQVVRAGFSGDPPAPRMPAQLITPSSRPKRLIARSMAA